MKSHSFSTNPRNDSTKSNRVNQWLSLPIILLAGASALLGQFAEGQTPPSAGTAPAIDPMTSQPREDNIPNFTRVEQTLTSVESALVRYRKEDKVTLEKKLADLRREKAALEKVVLADRDSGIYKIVWTPPPTLDPLLVEASNELTKFLGTADQSGEAFEKRLAKIEEEILRLRDTAAKSTSPSKEDLEKRIENLSGARAAMRRDYHREKLLRLERASANLHGSVQP